ncbi:MAG: hypothetical protein ACAI25_07900, partial [Planctomycetota bacterium]
MSDALAATPCLECSQPLGETASRWLCRGCARRFHESCMKGAKACPACFCTTEPAWTVTRKGQLVFHATPNQVRFFLAAGVVLGVGAIISVLVQPLGFIPIVAIVAFGGVRYVRSGNRARAEILALEGEQRRIEALVRERERAAERAAQEAVAPPVAVAAGPVAPVAKPGQIPAPLVVGVAGAMGVGGVVLIEAARGSLTLIGLGVLL